jgi:hypothetical protein
MAMPHYLGVRSENRSLIPTLALIMNTGRGTDNGTVTGQAASWWSQPGRPDPVRLSPLRPREASGAETGRPAGANRSLQIVHVPGGRECLCASGTIASRIEPLGARQGR